MSQQDRNRALEQISELHAPRSRSGDGFTTTWCRECQQDWPCPSFRAVEAHVKPPHYAEYGDTGPVIVNNTSCKECYGTGYHLIRGTVSEPCSCPAGRAVRDAR